MKTTTTRILETLNTFVLCKENIICQVNTIFGILAKIQMLRMQIVQILYLHTCEFALYNHLKSLELLKLWLF